MHIQLKSRELADFETVKSIFCINKKMELNGELLPHNLVDKILDFQFEAFEKMIHNSFPNSEDYIIEADCEKAGRLLLNIDTGEIKILNISLFPAFFNKGIGTFVLNKIINETVNLNKTLRLEVNKDNKAVALYTRLGFQIKAENELKLFMQYCR